MWVFVPGISLKKAKRTGAEAEQAAMKAAKPVYERAKKAVIAKFSTAVDDSLPDGTRALLEQLRGYHANVGSFNRMSVYVACMIGRNVSMIHQRYKNDNHLKEL